jgi:hypothetical protein
LFGSLIIQSLAALEEGCRTREVGFLGLDLSFHAEISASMAAI